MADLRVELYGELVGHLRGTDQRTFDFVTHEDALEKFGLASTLLSESVPFDLVPSRSRAGRRRNFFAELLPEGTALDSLAAQIRVAPTDVIALLRQFGRDVAGAVQIWDPDAPGEPRVPDRVTLGPQAIATMLAETQGAPLGNRPASGRTSLAGVQDKIVLALDDGHWFQVIDGYPSTHILKPLSRRHPTMIFDEEYGQRAAKAIGVTAFDTRIEFFDKVPALVIERFDRSSDAPLGRIHQEDMNQALGAAGNQKYQEFGGRMSLRRVAQILGRSGDRWSMEQLLSMVTLAQSVGNLDMHGKNIGLLHPPGGRGTIAPAYDVVPQSHVDGGGRMALSINGKYLHAAITVDDLVAEGESWGLRGAREKVIETVSAIQDFAGQEVPVDGAHPSLRADVARFVRNLLAGRPTGVD